MFCIILISKALSSTSCSFVLSHIARYAPSDSPVIGREQFHTKNCIPIEHFGYLKGCSKNSGALICALSEVYF